MCMYHHIAIDISKAACVYTLLCSWRAGHSCLGQNPKLEFHKVHCLKLEPCKTKPGLLWMNVNECSGDFQAVVRRTFFSLSLDFRLSLRWKRDLRFSGVLPSLNGSLLPTFRNKLSVPSSTVRQFLTACQKSADILCSCLTCLRICKCKQTFGITAVTMNITAVCHYAHVLFSVECYIRCDFFIKSGEM
jgi:hypothetical protein